MSKQVRPCVLCVKGFWQFWQRLTFIFVFAHQKLTGNMNEALDNVISLKFSFLINYIGSDCGVTEKVVEPLLQLL